MDAIAQPDPETMREVHVLERRAVMALRQGNTQQATTLRIQARHLLKGE